MSLFGTDPSLADSDGDGISDSVDDQDGDGIPNISDPLPVDFNYMDGDVNADGVVDADDMLLAMKIATGQITPTTLQIQHGDVVPTPIPNGIIDMDDALIIMRKAIGLVSMNLKTIHQALSEYAKEHEEQQELIAHLKTAIIHHKDQLLLSIVDLDDRIVTQVDDMPKVPIKQSSPAMKKGILVATIGDLTGLLSGPYEDIYYYVNDHLSTPQMLTDQNATVVWQADYDPFGKATVNDDPDGNGTTVTNNVRFPGQYFDSETGLHYNYHRYYDPGIGRYLQPDPSQNLDHNHNASIIELVLIPQELNLFAYSTNNPMNIIDPKGLMGCRPNDGPDKKGKEGGSLCAQMILNEMIQNRNDPDRICRQTRTSITADCLVCCGETLTIIQLPYGEVAVAICVTICEAGMHNKKKEICCDE